MSSSDKKMYGDPSGLANDMKRLVNVKEMSDVKFIIGSTRKAVYGHRCILSARCEVFRAMFNEALASKDLDTPFVLADVQPEVFLSLLEYIYTNSVVLSNRSAVEVLGIGLEYGLDGLKQMCMDYMCDTMSINSACEALQAGVSYGLEQLKDRALKYIEENTQKIFGSKGFQELSDVALSFILQSDNLTADEMEVLTAVREWAAVNSVVLNKPMRNIAEKVVVHIRLPLLGPDELGAVEEENKKDSLIGVESLSFAWKCHALGKADPSNPLTRRRKGTEAKETRRTLQSV